MRWRMDNPTAEVVAPELLPDSAVKASPLGEEQGDALALFFGALPEAEQPTVAFCSPFERTRQTANFALSRLKKPVKPKDEPRLREIEFGIFAGLTKRGRAAKFPEQWAQRRKVGKINYRPEGGENWYDLSERFSDFSKDEIETLPADAVVLIATHENFVSVSEWKWVDGDLDVLSRESVPSASITTYDYDGKTFTLVSRHVLPPSPTGKNLFSTESKDKDV
jgi:Fructose-2,6-bisphosphatase